MIALLVDHLWQSTLFALVAGLLTLPLRKNSAGVRYALWFAASVKFLIPFALLAAAGGALASWLHLTLIPPHEAAAAASVNGPLDWAPGMMAPAAAFQASPPAAFAPAHALAAPIGPVTHALALRIHPAPILLGAWVLGLAALLLIWAVRWSRIRAVLRRAAPVDLAVPIPAVSTPTGLEPGVVGLWRPVLVLPEGIADQLSPAEFDAIIAHELCHVRRRDNLTGAIHMLVQALFWFHPLVWWLGHRLIDERERACDEAVVRAGHDRETYAYGIIQTCRLYLNAPLICVAGASGSNLEMRVDEIMSRPLSAPLALEAKASIGLAGALALTVPVVAGLLTAPPITRPLAQLVQAAQTAVLPEFSARPSSPPAPPLVSQRPAATAQVATPVIEAELHQHPPRRSRRRPGAAPGRDRRRPAEPRRMES